MLSTALITAARWSRTPTVRFAAMVHAAPRSFAAIALATVTLAAVTLATMAFAAVTLATIALAAVVSFASVVPIALCSFVAVARVALRRRSVGAHRIADRRFRLFLHFIYKNLHPLSVGAFFYKGLPV